MGKIKSGELKNMDKLPVNKSIIKDFPIKEDKLESYRMEEKMKRRKDMENIIRDTEKLKLKKKEFLDFLN